MIILMCFSISEASEVGGEPNSSRCQARNAVASSSLKTSPSWDLLEFHDEAPKERSKKRRGAQEVAGMFIASAGKVFHNSRALTKESG